MPRGRRKVRGGILLTLQSDRGGSSDSFGAPRTKETRLDSVDSDLSDPDPSPAPPLLALNPSQLLHSVSSPSRSLRDKITDYFGYNEDPDLYRSRSCSPEMPVLIPQVSSETPASPTSPSSCDGSEPELSEQSCGNSDSGKENEEEPETQRLRGQGGARPRSDSNKMPLQQSQPVAAGRVTRSASGKVPLSLKGCESLQNELNIAEGSFKGDNKEAGGPVPGSPPAPATAQSPPTPHKIIRVKEPIICNPLNKLKSISLTPKKSTKSSKQTKRPPAPSSPAQQQTTNTSSTKAGRLQAAAATSHKVTEYFPIRRSERKPKAELIKEELETIGESLSITDDSRHGIEVAPIENKGRGIKAVKTFNKGDFVVEYAGDLIDIGTAKDLESKYSMDASKGCYMYYFKHKGKQYCIDATSESGRYGRLLNHSRVSPNCITKVVMIKEVPRLILVAKHAINSGEELLYDYGDRSKESMKAHPWLAL